MSGKSLEKVSSVSNDESSNEMASRSGSEVQDYDLKRSKSFQPNRKSLSITNFLFQLSQNGGLSVYLYSV